MPRAAICALTRAEWGALISGTDRVRILFAVPLKIRGDGKHFTASAFCKQQSSAFPARGKQEEEEDSARAGRDALGVGIPCWAWEGTWNCTLGLGGSGGTLRSLGDSAWDRRKLGDGTAPLRRGPVGTWGREGPREMPSGKEGGCECGSGGRVRPLNRQLPMSG